MVFRNKFLIHQKCVMCLHACFKIFQVEKNVGRPSDIYFDGHTHHLFGIYLLMPASNGPEQYFPL